jgi:hypothetical protein
MLISRGQTYIRMYISCDIPTMSRSRPCRVGYRSHTNAQTFEATLSWRPVQAQSALTFAR